MRVEAELLWIALVQIEAIDGVEVQTAARLERRKVDGVEHRVVMR